MPGRAAVVLLASPPPTIEKGPDSTVSIKVTVTGDDTLMSFERSATFFAKDLEIKGFRKGSKVPTQVIVAQVGADAVKSKALQDLSDRAISYVSSAGTVALVGQSKLKGGEDPVIARYNPGDDLVFEIQCDVWPELRWKGQLSDVPTLEVAQEPVDTMKVDAALRSIQERYLVKSPTADGYAAQMGDGVLGSMRGFLVADSGAKGDLLPAVASGDNVEVVLEEGKFMPGLVEGLVGCVAGDAKEVRVSFPAQVSRNLGEDLAGKAAIFEVAVDSVVTRQLPELNDAFADSVRPGLTFQGLYDEVRAGVGEEGDRRNVAKRNAAIEAALVDLVDCDVPETIIVDQAKEKFARMMSEQREAGVSDEDLKQMITKEGFEKYKKVASKNIKRTMAASLAIEELSRREGIVADAMAAEDQLQLMRAQAEQAGQPFDEAQTKESLDATLKRDAVMNWLATQLPIEYKEEE